MPLARSRYSGWCMCQHSTTWSRLLADIVPAVAEHFGNHQRDPVLRHVAALCIFFGIFADLLAVGDVAVSVDYLFCQPAIAAYLDIVQHYAILQGGASVD